ncbi:hypothetical protein BTR23_12765 [Alkalihalophilus pseudofirmus]|uniref:TRAP transporter substrate-binding protein n=1 Tax=Alkalihalobacterium alkalinitrilicum TaxID=427920 RepID=UPI00094D6129|nr:TRAP transporter substrate-binding protein [Alkalihalobacterium alkalinitrilicum]OLO38016.1 hypothetical protein BTR23_12765 [Alkalihalophilus pseudofirmus]
MNNNVKTLFYIALFTMIIMLAACGGSSTETVEETNNDSQDQNETATSDETYTIKIPERVIEGHYVADGLQKFKELVEEKSDGRIQVDLYLGGTLSSSNEEDWQLLMDGAVETIIATSLNAAQAIDTFNVFEYPFLFENRDNLYEFIDGPFGDQLSEELEAYIGGKVLGFYDIGANVFMSNKTIEEPNDLSGLRLRTSETRIIMDTVQAMGGNPTPIAFSELYTSLQQGQVDGLATTLPLMYDSQFYEVVKQLTVTEHSYVPVTLIVNNDFFESLPADLQDVIVEAGNELTEFGREYIQEVEVNAVNNLKEAGVEITELSPEQFEKFREAVQPAIEKNIHLIGEETYQQVIEILQ